MYISRGLKIKDKTRIKMVRMVILLLFFAEDVFKMYSQDEIENFRCIFDMFDKDRTGYVNIEDLQTIIQSLDRNPDEA
jgi:Ca2+-binding EF-hand superfamily protein